MEEVAQVIVPPGEAGGSSVMVRAAGILRCGDQQQAHCYKYSEQDWIFSKHFPF
jgi:hypothetical protein